MEKLKEKNCVKINLKMQKNGREIQWKKIY